MSTPSDASAPSRRHPQLLRTYLFDWWRPLLGLAALAVCWLMLELVAAFVDVGVGGFIDYLPLDVDGFLLGPVGMLYVNLYLAALIPLSIAAARVGHGAPAGWVASVTGRFRWRSLARAACVSGPWLALAVLGWMVLTGGVPDAGGRDVLFVAVVLATTPLQAAGEEYLFRGWFSQALGSWFASPVVCAVVAALASAAVFSWAHGDQSVWEALWRFLLGLMMSVLVWWTGGLEAAIAVHAGWNLAIFVPLAYTGALDDALAYEGDGGNLLWVLTCVGIVGVAVVLAGTWSWWAGERSTGAPEGAPPRELSNLAELRGVR
jgi:membrane protease YdiL (CAAX protease family)